MVDSELTQEHAPKGTFLYEWGKGRYRICVYSDGEGGSYSEAVDEEKESMSEIDKLLADLMECAEEFRALLDELEAVCSDECYSEYVNQDKLPSSVQDFVIEWSEKYPLYDKLEHELPQMLSYSCGELLNVIERSFYANKRKE